MQSQSKQKGEAGIGTSGERILLCFLLPGAIPLTTKVASILAPNYEIMRKIQECKCGLCQIPLEKLKIANPLAYAMLGYNQ